MSTTEETVQTETPAKTSAAPKSFREHFEAAKAAQSASKEADHDGETPPDDDTSTESETPPAQEPEKPADEPTDAGQEPDETLLTPEELAALPPKERQRAEKWQAKLTKKAQDLAAARKQVESWSPLIDALQANPDEALAELAKQRGMTLVKADQKKVETATDETLAELPAELQFLKPVFDAYGKKVLEQARGELAPIKEAQDQFISKAIASETEATVAAFEAKHPGWKTHEAKMLQIGQKVIPASNAMTDFEYMELLYTLATADQTNAERARKVVDKINKSASESEPTTPGAPEGRIVHTLPPPGKRSIREAYAAAKRGERWE